MPIPTPTPSPIPLFPSLTREHIDGTRTSAWYLPFRSITIPSIIIDLDQLGEREAFLEWLDADSIFLPEGSQTIPDNGPGPSTSGSRASSISSNDSDSSSTVPPPVYRLPKLNEAIRQALTRRRGGNAVFPKLNWSSPKDAAFILPQSEQGPLHCTSPADVYLLLKSSDFISHGLNSARAYASGDDTVFPEHMDEGGNTSGFSDMKVELVLKEHVKWINPSREFRCFVRNNILIGVCQRDSNFYDHLQQAETRESLCDHIRAFWEDEMRGRHPTLGDDYVFDLHMTPDLTDANLIDINPYRASTDPLLFKYVHLLTIIQDALVPIFHTSNDRPRLPILRVIESPSHPDASRITPAYGGNMMPLEMIEMSQGRSLEEFTEAWQDAVARGMNS